MNALEQPVPYASVEAERTAVRAGQLIKVPITFPCPLPAVPKPMTILWTELVNCRYMGMDDVTPQGCTLVWEAPEAGRTRVRATVMLPSVRPGTSP